MLLRRCAWHKQYRGYGRLLGVSSWRGRGVTYSDGMCADCAARTRAAWQLPASSRIPTPRAGIPWATAAVSLATAAVVFGIVVGPTERAVSPRPTGPTRVVADVAPRPTSRPVVAQNPVAADRVPQQAAAGAATVATGFGPGDARGLAGTGPAAPRRIARARARGGATVAGHFRPEPEPEVLVASLAEVDAEWSANVVAVATAAAEETPAALPQVVVAPPVDTQAP